MDYEQATRQELEGLGDVRGK